MTKRLVVPILISAFTALSYNTARAADVVAGKQLHDAKCYSCHDTNIYTRAESIIFSKTALKNRVKFCEAQTKSGWSEAQINDVVEYLNQNFYKYK